MKRMDADKLPEAVKAAHTRAEAWLQERFRGRRIVPQPVVVQLPVPELGEDAALHAILVPPAGEARARIDQALLLLARAKDRGAQSMAEAGEQAESLLLVEACFWVEGMSEAQKDDPRPAARDFLRELREEVGALGRAWDSLAAAALELIQSQEARLGKLSTSRTG